jgi:putative peptidoglycan lipid II flippase
MRQVVILCPFALGFIAYRGLGAVLRSVRKFRAYYLGELAVAAVALLALWPFRREVTSVPLSLAVAFALGAILLWFPARPLLASTRPSERVVDWQALVRSALAAAPIYLCVQSLVVVERFFASFLAEGAISALGFAQLLAVVVPTTLAFETVLLTPLAEGSDRGFLLSRAASAALLVGLPIAVFGWCEASALVDLLFGRGRFDAAAVAMTGEAFRWAALGVPALLSWPVLTRALQVVGRYGEIARLGAGAVVLTVVLDAVVVFVCGGGVGALAAVSAAVGTVTVVGGIRALAGAGIELSTRGVRSAFGVACVAGAAAWATALSPPAVATLPLVGRGVLFCGVYAAVALSVPSREIAILRELVEHSFPALRRRGAGTGV